MALHGLAEAKKRGVKVTYRITTRGPEFEHLQSLAEHSGHRKRSRSRKADATEDYIRELQNHGSLPSPESS